MRTRISIKRDPSTWYRDVKLYVNTIAGAVRQSRRRRLRSVSAPTLDHQPVTSRSSDFDGYLVEFVSIRGTPPGVGSRRRSARFVNCSSVVSYPRSAGAPSAPERQPVMCGRGSSGRNNVREQVERAIGAAR
jgi:hypothetical protein